jgi:hypothetical protein
LFFSRDVGRGSSKATGFEYAWQSRLLLNRLETRPEKSRPRSAATTAPCRQRRGDLNGARLAHSA